MRLKSAMRVLFCIVSTMLMLGTWASAEQCSTSTEMDAATKASLRSTAAQWFPYIAQGNAQALAANSIPEIASNVAGLTGILEDHKANLAGASASVRNVYLLDATGGTAPIDKADFFCGVFNSSDKIGFTFQNLPAGKYGLVIMDVQNSKIPYFYSFLMLQQGGTWKMAGLFPRPRQIAGHDALWYWQHARDYEAKGQKHNAWFYYLVARELVSPVAFMSTSKLDTFGDELQQAMPPDLPEQRTLSVQGTNGKTYEVTNLFVVPNEQIKGLDLVIKYKAADISDTGKTFLENKEVMKAVLAKYPEIREPFGNLVARAVAPSGQDFGSELPVKDVK